MPPAARASALATLGGGCPVNYLQARTCSSNATVPLGRGGIDQRACRRAERPARAGARATRPGPTRTYETTVSGASGRSGHVLDDQHRRPLGVVVPQLDNAQLPAAAERDHPLDDLPGDPERPRGNLPGDREHDHRRALSPDAGARKLRSARVKRGKLLGLMRSGRPLTISGPEALVGEIPEAVPGRELATGAA
jgi:hypothetical protein